MTRIDLDEFATLARVFGDRVRIERDGVVTIERLPRVPAEAVRGGEADLECSDREIKTEDLVGPLRCQASTSGMPLHQSRRYSIGTPARGGGDA